VPSAARVVAGSGSGSGGEGEGGGCSINIQVEGKRSKKKERVWREEGPVLNGRIDVGVNAAAEGG
jgi:hypothetical protein